MVTVTQCFNQGPSAAPPFLLPDASGKIVVSQGSELTTPHQGEDSQVGLTSSRSQTDIDVNLEVAAPEVGESNVPANGNSMVASQLLYLLELSCSMPSSSYDGVIRADGEVLLVEVRAPDFEIVDDGEELLLVGEVIHFCGKEFLVGEGNGVFARWSLGVGGGFLDGGSFGGVTREMLGQDDSHGEVGGVGGDVEMASGVGDLEDGGGGDELFDGIEGILAAVVPSEGFVLAGEFVERVQDVGEVADKGAVVVGKAEK
ncbi:hypothetical protein CBR_g66712 [Chara braunii]|uniref:Uncharacterized protein n=1 Tax=Chara braunii TaxID=69332 RepID=A0A388JQ49_CHABU|nr:hypothetical protein CBR_g66712 [Chara braunii]|eukprot:GBG59907.1 hypothetical protein CBR_g66712 [Chara braunii]